MRKLSGLFKEVKVYRGRDFGSDHFILEAKIKLKRRLYITKLNTVNAKNVEKHTSLIIYQKIR
jgi:hypothetical protein